MSKSKMPIDEKECFAKINALSQQDWQILLDLIPEIENTSQFGAWKGGRQVGNSFTAPWCELSADYDFDSLDLVTKCKLITAIVRSDRFSEGALVSAFNSGVVLRILKSIEREVTAKNGK